MIVKMGSWLFGRKVLISPQALENADWESRTLDVNLLKTLIRSSPDIDTDKPLFHQHGEKLSRHYSGLGIQCILHKAFHSTHAPYKSFDLLNHKEAIHEFN